MATEPGNEAEAGRLLHINMLAGDPVAFDQIYQRYHAILVAHVRAYIAGNALYLDSYDRLMELCGDAADDALLAYYRNPRSYDPERRSLAGYLRMSAVGDFKNAFDRELKAVAKVVRISDERWNSEPSGELDLADGVEDQLTVADMRSRYGHVASTEQERIALDLMFESESKTEVFAQAMGIAHLSPKDQEAAVNKTKDRLSKRLKRGYRRTAAD